MDAMAVREQWSSFSRMLLKNFSLLLGAALLLGSSIVLAVEVHAEDESAAGGVEVELELEELLDSASV